MSSTDNIYIPYIEGFHDEEKFFIYKNYYEELGFNVKKIYVKKEDDINYQSIINALLEEDEEIFIFVDYALISKSSILDAIDLAIGNECLVIPTSKTYFISDSDEFEKIKKSINGDNILESFFYKPDDGHRIYPMSVAWVFHKNIFDNPVSRNENLVHASVYDFDLCYKQYILKNLIFVKSDSYKFDPPLVSLDKRILFIYKLYIDSIINLFGMEEGVFLYENGNANIIPPDEVKELIFNSQKYFSQRRYI